MGKGYISELAGQGKQLNIAGDPFICKAVGKDTANEWSLFEATALPGSVLPDHKHEGFDEAFYILEGELEMSVEGEKVTAPAGYLLTFSAERYAGIRTQSRRQQGI